MRDGSDMIWMQSENDRIIAVATCSTSGVLTIKLK